MLDKLTASIDYHGKALTLRAQRQQVLSSNIANADTPGFQARDMDFSAQLDAATGARKSAPGTLTISSTRSPGITQRPGTVATTDGRHLAGLSNDAGRDTALNDLKYRTPDQASLDGNTVNLDMERANFADNSMRYEASLRFINGSVRKILTAIRGE